MEFFYSIGSSSRGNASLYVQNQTAVLIDIGVSVRGVKNALHRLDMGLEQLTGVLVTHDHGDHIKGMQTFARQYDIPVYAGPLTARSIARRVPEAEKQLVAFSEETGFDIGSIHVTPMRTPHDTAESYGYILTTQKHRFGFVTDMGFMPSGVRKQLYGCDTVVIESNHDLAMLDNGPYPWPLKERVRGNRGHLSNLDCAVCVSDLAQHGTSRFILAHISEQNNLPELALQESRRALAGKNARVIAAPPGPMDAPVLL